MESIFVTTQVSVQVPNNVSPPVFGCPVTIKGIGVTVDGSGRLLSRSEELLRPAGANDLSPQLVDTLNRQLEELGYKLVPLTQEAS